ncbi:hypothetical protein [Duganella sp. Leaf126]|uniref:hypothetical protein n=1 Tax=Duganella sp. Leaf126 TaxID=1736266 RepID=UPI000B06BABE|nr:hypothetical protein [Duganella sp. Leaf126]
MKTIVHTLALAALGIGAGAVQARDLPAAMIATATAPLQHAVISATYNGDAAGMLALDHDFASGLGTNSTRLDPTSTGVEFLTADFLFGVDVSAAGALTVIANSAIPAGAYSMRFDFGASLGAPIASFTYVGADGASGVPVLSLVNDHTIALDLGALQWSEFGAFTAQVGTASPVPEPAGAAMIVLGLTAIGAMGRLRRWRRQPRRT